MNDSATLDASVRLAAFRFLREQVALHGETLPWSVLLRGFEFSGVRVPLASQQGIFKPRVLPDLPLTLRTSPPSKRRDPLYSDEIGSGGEIHYCYRTDVEHGDNRRLRTAMQRRIPLIHLHGIVEGVYLPSWPVYVVRDDSIARRFVLQVDQADVASGGSEDLAAAARATNEFGSVDLRRRYVTVQVQRRVHQQAFRLRVLSAYRRLCAICRLKHEEMLDAAHILPDGHPRGDATVPNGLALCSLHHRAFDANLFGITPDLVVVVRPDVLRESDGPTLVHGVQGLHGHRLKVLPLDPALKPDEVRLAERFELFRQVASG